MSAVADSILVISVRGERWSSGVRQAEKFVEALSEAEMGQTLAQPSRRSDTAQSQALGLAKFAAMRRASSLVSRLMTARRLGSSS